MIFTKPRSYCTLALTLLMSGVATARISNSDLKPSSGLSFVENKGQVTDQYQHSRADVQYKLSAGGMNIFIGNGQIHYQWTKYTDTAAKGSVAKIWRDEPHSTRTAETYRLDMMLEGADRNARVITELPQGDYSTYYTATAPNGIKANAYKKITYKNVYPAIDWVLYVENNSLKYDFVVRKGGDPARIKLHYDGQTSLKLQDGNVQVTTPFGAITEAKPYSYDAETKKEIPSSFIIEGNTLRFKTQPAANGIVIDPLLNWATYYGEYGEDWIFGSSADNAGNIYACGKTGSIANIATTGAHQVSFVGNYEAFLVKFNSSGVRQWGTYYAGTNDDMFYGTCIDKYGDIFVTGTSFSTAGIATSGVHQATRGSSGNAILVKFNASGTRQWGTYYGNDYTEGYDLATDTAGNIYMAGTTSSNTAIATSGAHQSSISSYQDGFLVKFNNAGVRQWGTYYGGWDDEDDISVACGKVGNVYITGTTSSSNGIATTGAFKTTLTGNNNCFLAKFNTNGVRQWGSYFGGYQYDYSGGVACDSLDNAYITGTYGTSQFNNDAFIALFPPAGNVAYANTFGGTDWDMGLDIEFAAPNALYISGYTQSTGIATAGASQSVHGGGYYDAFCAKFGALLGNNWITYFGGNGYDFGNTVSFGGGNKVYIGGDTKSSNIATTGAHQTTSGGFYEDGFLTSLTDCIVPAYPLGIIGPDTVCAGGTYTYTTTPLTGATLYTWADWNGTATGSSTTNTINFTFTNNDAEIVLGAKSTCGNTALIGYYVTVITPRYSNVTVTGSTVFCQGDSVRLTGLSNQPFTYTWLRNDTAINAATDASYYAKASGKYHLVITDAYGCADTSAKTTVTVNPLPQPVISVSNMFDLYTTAFQAYQWYKDGQPINGAQSIGYFATANGSYQVEVTDNNGCSNMSTPVNITTVSITDLEKAGNTLDIYPNPASGFLTVKGMEEAQYTITGITGTMYLNGNISSNDNTINIRSLAPGSYIIRVTGHKGEKQYSKFTKQ